MLLCGLSVLFVVDCCLLCAVLCLCLLLSWAVVLICCRCDVSLLLVCRCLLLVLDVALCGTSSLCGAVGCVFVVRCCCCSLIIVVVRDKCLLFVPCCFPFALVVVC